MRTLRINLFIISVFLLLSSPLTAQSYQSDPAFQSITEAEIRDHLYFLASDFMNGRYSLSPEYELAAQYVATQFAGAGLLPPDTAAPGYQGYLQGVPFVKTIMGDDLTWRIENGVETIELKHQGDFKIIRTSEMNHENLELVYVGYGIMEPDEKWNDLEDLDLKGKIAVCLSGAPVKKGKPVLSEKVHQRYTSRRGDMTKVFTGLASQGAAGVIIIDLDGSSARPFDEIQSSFSTERTVYAGSRETNRQGSFPSMYMAKPEFLDLIMPGQKNNPLLNPEQILKNYQPQELSNVRMTARLEVLSQDTIHSNNVVGIVPGTDPELKKEFLVVGAHLDHVRPSRGQINNGADDNASGSVGVIEMAEAIAMNPTKRSVVFVTFTAEEMGLLGSKYFVESNLVPIEQVRFMMNLDMIGRSDPEHEENRAHYARTSSKYLNGLTKLISAVNDNVTDFPILVRDDAKSPGGSDHMSFLSKDIPAFFFFSGMHKDLHQPGDDAEKIDYAKAESISRLGYLMIRHLGNADQINLNN